MKRRALEQHLRDHACEFLRHAGKHDVWINPATMKLAPIPRHTDVKRGTAQQICKTLGVPPPN